MIAPGTLLQDRYLVESQVGQGGMGSVYVATDRRFGSTVAIKETHFDDAGLRRAFEREARLLNRLRHAALPRVSDHFEEGAGQFLVMEFIPGEDLSGLLKARGRPFPAGDVLAWADQLLDALDYLHTQEPSVVHRDIKPQNLKLLPRNQIVLLDFGLAKGTPLQTRVTATGSLFGYSFNYAPIEQMQGAGTDPRSDLYSLGATLYHLLTGAPPPDALTRATAVLNGDPDPLRPAGEAAPHVPAPIAGLLSRAMALSAAARFASAAEMREALRGAAAATSGGLGEVVGYAGTGAAAPSEHETRLLNAGGAPPTLRGARGAETGVGAAGGATLANTEMAGGATLVSQKGDADKEDSVRTRLAAPGQAAEARGGWASRRRLGVAAGVLAAAIVGVAAYNLTGDELRQAPAPALLDAPGPEAQAPATEPAAPAEGAATEPQAAPSPEAAGGPAPSQPRQAQRAAPRGQTAREPESHEGPQAPGRHPPAPPAPPAGVHRVAPPHFGPDVDEEVRRSFEGRDWVRHPLTEQEVQDIMRRAQQRRRNRAQEMRRRAPREGQRQPAPAPAPEP